MYIKNNRVKTVFIMMMLVSIINYEVLAKAVENVQYNLNIESYKPIFEVEKIQESQILDENNLIAEYEFKIKNFNEEKINDMNLIYSIEILDYEKINTFAKIQLYKKEEDIIELKLNQEGVSELCLLTTDKKEERIFLIKIEIEDENKKMINEEIKDIKIKLNVVQKLIE